jgi:hypothetical protein
MRISSMLIVMCILVILAIFTILTISPTPTFAVEDKFGITEIYPSSGNETEWYSTWDNGYDRVIEYGQTDPYDNSFEVTGNGRVAINGEDGIASITGSAPRMRVSNDFENVEVTFYAKRISEDDEISYQGFVAGARSKHYTDALCGANTYYGRFTYDGRVSFEKELFHGHGDVAQFPPPDAPSQYAWPEDEGIPTNDWIGFKFVIKTLPDNGSVLLELYRDLTDGRNGGDWEKVLEFIDIGEWYVEAEEGICSDFPHNKILFTPGFVFIRNDFIDEAEYKKFSIREIT